MNYLSLTAVILTIVIGFLSIIGYIKKDEHRTTTLEIQLQNTHHSIVDLQENFIEMRKDMTTILLTLEKIKTIVEKEN